MGISKGILWGTSEGISGRFSEKNLMTNLNDFLKESLRNRRAWSNLWKIFKKNSLWDFRWNLWRNCYKNTRTNFWSNPWRKLPNESFDEEIHGKFSKEYMQEYQTDFWKNLCINSERISELIAEQIYVRNNEEISEKGRSFWKKFLWGGVHKWSSTINNREAFYISCNFIKTKYLKSAFPTA